MKQLRDESIAQVQHALAGVFPEDDDALVSEHAHTLVAIAETYSVSITDALLPWIHRRYPEKEWSGAEWRRWCERYSEALEEARMMVVQRLLGLEDE